MKFKYLNENPLKTDHPLEFGHKEIVSSLKKIIKEQSWNLTIGLFGSWGTGKSSIVENLKEQLKTQKTPLIIFDVWKHEGNALRRTFLKECYKQLLNSDEFINNNFELDDRLSSNTNRSKEIHTIKWRKLGTSILVGILIITGMFFAACLIYGVLLLLDVDLFDVISKSMFISFATASVSATLLVKYFEVFIKTEKLDIKEDKFQDPHEFEFEFSRIVKSSKTEDKKIVICFDNLDRVSGDKALNIISTIKTFLDFKCDGNEANTVVFLIPCDVESIKNHISDSIKNNTENGESNYIDEFLRKFFNTSVWIPDFHLTDLESFAVCKT